MYIMFDFVFFTFFVNFLFTFTFDGKFCWYKWKKWFLQAMAVAKASESEVSEVWCDSYDDRYIHQFQPETTHRIH